MENYELFFVDISKIIIAHEFTLNEKSKCEFPNGRKSCGIIYCIEGEAEYKFSTKKIQILRKGDILILSSSASYSITVKKEFRHYTINFELHDNVVFTNWFGDNFYLLNTDNAKLYYYHFRKIVEQWKNKKIDCEMQSIGLLYELLGLVVSEIYEKEHQLHARMRLYPAKEYMEQNFDKYICLDMLANMVDMSVTNFRREWAKYYKETPLQYRDKLRLQYAKEYLSIGYYTVSEVALKCGFHDVNYFVRFFKKHVGISPGRYKELIF